MRVRQAEAWRHAAFVRLCLSAILFAWTWTWLGLVVTVRPFGLGTRLIISVANAIGVTAFAVSNVRAHRRYSRLRPRD